MSIVFADDFVDNDVDRAVVVGRALSLVVELPPADDVAMPRRCLGSSDTIVWCLMCAALWYGLESVAASERILT